MPPDSNELQLQQQQGTPAPAAPVAQQAQQPSGIGLPPQQDGRSNETRMAMLEWEISALKREIDEQKEELDTLVSEKEKLMRWGIMALGAAVLGMGTWIFNFIFSHIKP